MTKTKILPPITQPFDEALQRNHQPKAANYYHAYRTCLRWEFGFTCAFCLSHEADLAKDLSEGTGLTQIEHFTPVSHDPSLRNDYDNCFYICRYCNRDRSARPNEDKQGRKLLNPCSAKWSAFFKIEDDEIKPRRKDPNASYTAEAYGFANPKKTRFRKIRRELLSRYQTMSRLHGQLTAQIDKNNLRAIETARDLYRVFRLVKRDVLRHYRAIPDDAEASCRCESDFPKQLPKSLQTQLLEADYFH